MTPESCVGLTTFWLRFRGLGFGEDRKPQVVILVAILFRATSGTRTQDPSFTKAYQTASATVHHCPKACADAEN
jgi:hypothetical protein